METEKIRKDLYGLMDSFLTEAKTLDGKDRSLRQLNQDRHLFIDNAMKLINDSLEAQRNEIIAMIKGIEEFEETYCEKDEYLLRKIKEKILTNLTEEQ